MAPILGYWSIRGLAEPIRYLLHYTGTEYEDQCYDMGPDRATMFQSWFSVKETLGLKLANLPYYIDGDFKLTESGAITGLIARRHGLAGSCEEDFIKIAVAHGVAVDVLVDFFKLCYDPEFKNKLEAFVAEVPPKIERLSKLIEEGDYILGNKISHEDFFLFELIDRLMSLIPDSIAKHSNLVAYHQRIASLPAIAKYRDSPAFQKRKGRFWARMASFGAGEY